jgi:hypothetical protein
MGDLLFVMANLARHLEVDPEAALRRANAKFTRRFAGSRRARRKWANAPKTATSPRWTRSGTRPIVTGFDATCAPAALWLRCMRRLIVLTLAAMLPLGAIRCLRRPALPRPRSAFMMVIEDDTARFDYLGDGLFDLTPPSPCPGPATRG